MKHIILFDFQVTRTCTVEKRLVRVRGDCLAGTNVSPTRFPWLGKCILGFSILLNFHPLNEYFVIDTIISTFKLLLLLIIITITTFISQWTRWGHSVCLLRALNADVSTSMKNSITYIFLKIRVKRTTKNFHSPNSICLCFCMF